MAANDTQTAPQDVATFLATIDNKTRAADAQTLDTMFQRITGWKPRMWGPTIIGYGQYDYKYESGRAAAKLGPK